jgi:hypothetical protein
LLYIWNNKINTEDMENQKPFELHYYYFFYSRVY